MSYDVSIGDFSVNITYNIRMLFYDHFPASEERSASEHGLTADDIVKQSRGGLHSLHGLTGLDAIDVISAFLDNVRDRMYDGNVVTTVGHPHFCAKYDAKNGWGSTLGGVVAMGRLLAACSRFPDDRIRIS